MGKSQRLLMVAHSGLQAALDGALLSPALQTSWVSGIPQQRIVLVAGPQHITHNFSYD